MPTVVIAYNVFPDITVEEEVLSVIDAEIIHTGELESPAALAAARKADALMVTIEAVPAALIAEMERCGIISRAGTGVDAIDIAAATQKGILVTNVPDYSIDEVSTHAIALLLAQARRLPELLPATRRGVWDSKAVTPIERFQQQTLGLLGFGRIAQATARKGLGLGLQVISYDPYADDAAFAAAGVERVDWETLLARADYVSLHTPLTDETRGIINADALARMKRTAFLINTARGALVDEAALLDALNGGQIAGAALDVLCQEPPPPDHPLLSHERAILTPHIGWYSEAANIDVRHRAADEVVRFFSKEKPRSPVNQIDR